MLTGGAILGRALLHYWSIDRVLACACAIDSGAGAFVGGLKVAVGAMRKRGGKVLLRSDHREVYTGQEYEEEKMHSLGWFAMAVEMH